MEKTKVTVIIDKSKLKAYRRWLLEHDYRSPSQHLNEVIESIVAQGSAGNSSPQNEGQEIKVKKRKEKTPLTTPQKEKKKTCVVVYNNNQDNNSLSNNNQDKNSNSTNIPTCPIKEIVDLYHTILYKLPRVKVLNNTRIGYIRARWRELFMNSSIQNSMGVEVKDRESGLEWFKRFFEYVSESEFLMGEVPPSGDRPQFQATLEWLMRPTNFAKVLEGYYHRETIPVSRVTAHNMRVIKYLEEKYKQKEQEVQHD